MVLPNMPRASPLESALGNGSEAGSSGVLDMPLTSYSFTLNQMIPFLHLILFLVYALLSIGSLAAEDVLVSQKNKRD